MHEIFYAILSDLICFPKFELNVELISVSCSLYRT